MKFFLWAMLVVFAVDIAGRIIWMSTGNYPPRTPEQVGWDLAFNIGFAAWVVYLLASGGNS